MSDREEKKILAKEVTNDLLKDKYIQQQGQKAIVQREELQGEHLDALRSVLADIAADLQKTGVAPKTMEYLGSFSVHVFGSQVLGQVAFAALNNNHKCPVNVADGALRELNQTVKEYHGQKRQKQRSGF